MAKRAAPDILKNPRSDGPVQPTLDGYQISEFTNMTSEEFDNTLAQFHHNNIQQEMYTRGVVSSHLQLRALLYEAEKEIDKQKSKASEAETARDTAEAAKLAAETAKVAAEAAKKAAEAKLAPVRGELLQIKASSSKIPFALVLIDGDGYIFDERLIQQGTPGGQHAAFYVDKNIQFHLCQRFDDASNWRIVVKIYMNLDGLARKLYRAGRINSFNLMQDFAIGFNQSQPLYEIIDVGRGKERTDHKFKNNFDLFVPNTHCKHIILGCGHDHGYIPMLDQYKDDKRARDRITLLHTGELAQGYRQMPFTKFSFSEGTLKSSATLNIPDESGNRSPNKSITRQPTPPTSPTDLKTNKAQLSGGLMSPRSPSDETKNQNLQQSYIYPRPITVNKRLERIDQDLPQARAADVDALDSRMQPGRIKPCNEFNLIGRCSMPGCRYDHQRLLPEGERLAFARKTRTRICRKGSKCLNETCMYGHMCQFDAKGSCDYREECHLKRFHGMDTTVFKTYPITESGSVMAR